MKVNKVYDITVIVLTYNSDVSSLEKTLKSIILQSNIRLQIIIADDCSKIDIEKCVNEVMARYGFTEFLFLRNAENKGTVHNFSHALNFSLGEYVKPISPGDYLYNEGVLASWYKIMKEDNVLISFGDAVYYNYDENNKFRPIKKITQPALSFLYKSRNPIIQNLARISNIVLCDCILGASFICHTNLLEKYMGEIIGKIKFCEDYVYRLMLLDEIPIIYVSHPMLYYFYGGGISKQTNKNGESLLHQDENVFDQVILGRKGIDTQFQCKINKLITQKCNNPTINRVKSFLVFPVAFLLRVCKLMIIKLKISTTCMEIDEDFLSKIGE